MSTTQAQIQLQASFWNAWNAQHREHAIVEVSRRQAEVVLGWLRNLADANGRVGDILEVGCGACWFAPLLMPFGSYTGTDLSDEVLARARTRYPGATFIAGDFFNLDLGEGCFDVAVSLEVLSHVPDQSAFLAKIARHLKPGGHLMLATQNRPVLERNTIPPPAPGQLRRWVDRRELTSLLAADFIVEEMFSVTPTFDKGLLRLVNSSKLKRVLARVAPGMERRIRDVQERADLGWTLMARARKRG